MERARLVETLRGLFPGVREESRTSVSRRREETVARCPWAAGGLFGDAVVVDARSTAVGCVRHLREHRLGAMTFSTLDGFIFCKTR